MPRPSCSAIAIVLVALLAQACTADGSGTQSQTSANTPDDASAPDVASSLDARMPGRSYAPTMSAIYDEILSLNCAIAHCHIGGAGVTPIMSNKDHTYAQLVGVPAAGEKCGDAGLAGLLLVDPGHPETSLLYTKVERPPPAGLCGDPMPSGNAPPLPALDIEQIRQWIVQGATNN